MRILVTIPHAFFSKPGSARYGSETGDAATRATVLARCVSALHHNLNPGQRMVAMEDEPANTDRVGLTIAVVTSGEAHLAHALPPGLAYHHNTEAHPRLLGFACHAMLRANIGLFDWFCYMEDDLELTDGLFFDKLAWFNASFGDGALLQPNRYEVSDGPVGKLYVDGQLRDGGAAAPFQDITVRPRLLAPALGRTLEFRRTANPHAGCFFVSAAQMAVLAAHPAFAVADHRFCGPLESAASLAVMQCFDVYKPSPRNAAFLELRHLDARMLDRWVVYTKEAGGLQKTIKPDLS